MALAGLLKEGCMDSKHRANTPLARTGSSDPDVAAPAHAGDMRRAQQPRRSRIQPLVVSACLAAMTSTTATAQIPVTDGGSIFVQGQNLLKTVLEYGQTAKRWTATADHYKQQLIKIQRLQMLQSQMIDDFPQRADDYGMTDLCPAPKANVSSVINNALSSFNPSLDSNLIEEQRRLCQRIVLADNAKYNESVRMLKKIVQRNNEFMEIEKQRNQVGENQGKLAANDNEAQRFTARTKMDLDYWQARMKAYDDYIVALHKDQGRLARRALEGKREGDLGNVIQTQALKAAFSF